MQLNTIFYGPPGTGKTFNTVDAALKVVDPIFYKANSEEKDRANLTQRFNELTIKDWNTVDGQIGFITFHQNYSYEEFVQGIRPDLSENAAGLSFVKQDGIFKKMADQALKNKTAAASSSHILPTFEAVFEEFFKPLIEDGQPMEIPMESKGYHFKLVSYNESARNMPFEKMDGGRDHNIYIPTLKAFYEGTRTDIQGMKSYYKPLARVMKEKAEEMVKGKPTETLKKYVLIIDEINRANISRVFGELITLIETEKRWGKEYQMKLTLPSGELFTVPDNLYIVGTMNTADKSLALLDIALRRRFSFEPRYPNAEKVDAKYRSFFEKLNTLIYADKGADFTIGHSYFMTGEGLPLDLPNVMNEKVLPLLQEYYYSAGKEKVKQLVNDAVNQSQTTGYTLQEGSFGQLRFITSGQ